MKSRTALRTARNPERTRGAHRQIVVGRHFRRAREPHDFSVVGRLDADLVAEIEELEHGLQFVVAVGAAADDVQERFSFAGAGQRVTTPGGTAVFTETSGR